MSKVQHSFGHRLRLPAFQLTKRSVLVIMLVRIVGVWGLGRQTIPSPVVGPADSGHHDHSCETFTQTARFNPYSVTDSIWMTFYYWAAEDTGLTAEFIVPTQKEISWLKSFMEPLVERPVNWTARLLLMRDYGANVSYLLTERGDRGQYWIYPITKHLDGEEKKVPMDIRLKQTGDNKYLGLMKCEDETLYAMARVADMPGTSQAQDAAAALRYRRRGGRSYLYQGHQWMPVPELDHRKFWLAYRLPEVARRIHHDYFFD